MGGGPTHLLDFFLPKSFEARYNDAMQSLVATDGAEGVIFAVADPTARARANGLLSAECIQS